MENKMKKISIACLTILVSIIFASALYENRIKEYPGYRVGLVIFLILYIFFAVVFYWLSRTSHDQYIKPKKMIMCLGYVASFCLILFLVYYLIFPPPLPDITRYDDFDWSDGYIYNCAYYNGKIYPIISTMDNNQYANIRFYTQNKNEFQIAIKGITIEVVDYEDVKPVLFTVNKTDGGDGMIEDHIYYGIIQSYPSNNELVYCGDDDYLEPFFTESYEYNPSGNSVILDGGGIDWFFLSMEYTKPGIYKYRYRIDYLKNGRVLSEKSDTFIAYFPGENEFPYRRVSIYALSEPYCYSGTDIEIDRDEVIYLCRNIDKWFNKGVAVDQMASKGIQYIKGMNAMIGLNYHNANN